jgi:hypothetical protein
MADKKQKNPRLTTPRGILKYPRLTVPDTKFNEDGEYSTKLLLEPDGKDVAKFLKQLDTETDKAVEYMKAENKQHAKKIVRVPAYVNEVDKEGDETGKIELNFKMPAKVMAKKGPNKGKTFNFKPALFDAFGTPVEKELRIGGGTEGRVTFEFWPYFSAKDKNVGITRRMVAVKLIKLVEWNSNQDASAYGFDDEEDEDGFSVNAASAQDADDDTDDEDNESDTEEQSGSDF